MNSKGIVQNNTCVSSLLKELKTSKRQYKTLSNREERDMIDDYLSRGEEDELRKLLAMHNVRMVFSIAKKYCKNTRDFDNMIGRGLYGLTYAANRFNLFEPVTIKVKVGSEIVREDKPPYNPKIDPETGFTIERPVYVKKMKIDPVTCKPEYVKFCTYAHGWIFKYIVYEFERSSIKIDNNSISIDDPVRIKNSTDNNQTMENYIDDMVLPEYKSKDKTESKLEDDDVSNLYSKIQKYISETNELTALEKHIVTETYYNRKKIREIAEETSENAQSIINKKHSALLKIKNYLKEKFNIESLNDITV